MIKLLIVDSKIESLYLIYQALELENKEYQENAGITIRHEIIRQDLSGLNWTPYTDYLGVNQTWLAGETNRVDDKYYSIRYVFHDDNWKEKRIGGWHVGIINGFSIELIRHWNSFTFLSGEQVPWLYVAFLEEGMHAWDDVISKQLNIDINAYFGVDYDNGIVHAEVSGRTRWIYDDVLQKLKPFLNQLFNPMDLYKEKGREAIYWKLNGKYIWVSYQRMEDLVASGLVKWSDVREIDEKIIQEGVIA